MSDYILSVGQSQMFLRKYIKRFEGVPSVRNTFPPLDYTPLDWVVVALTSIGTTCRSLSGAITTESSTFWSIIFPKKHSLLMPYYRQGEGGSQVTAG